jgi:hypothetical protein
MQLAPRIQDIISSRLVDILVAGYLEGQPRDEASLLPERMLRFAPLWDRIYMRFTTGLLRFEVIEQGGAIVVGEVERLDARDEYDDGDGLAFTRITWPLLRSMGPVDIVACELWDPSEDGCKVKAVGFEAAHAYLFFDPMTLDGIAPGGDRERSRWMADYPLQRLVRVPLGHS